MTRDKGGMLGYAIWKMTLQVMLQSLELMGSHA